MAVVAPSSQLRPEQQRLAEQALQILEDDWGLQIAYTPDLTRSHLHLAGTDQERAAEFQQQLDDEKFGQSSASEGDMGWLDYCHCFSRLPGTKNQNGSLGSATAPYYFITSNATRIGWFVMGPRWPPHSLLVVPMQIRIVKPPEGRPVQIRISLCSCPILAKSGICEKEDSAGVASVILSALGTEAQVDLADSILFLEEVYEAPYRLDRMLTQMRQSGQFQKVRAFVFGEFVECGTPEQVKDVLLDVLGDLNLPMAIGLPHGHGEINHPTFVRTMG